MKSSIQSTNGNSKHIEYTAELNNAIKERQCIENIIESGGCCWICGYADDPRIIEKHHFAGKYNSNITIPVCPNCHRRLSIQQNGWYKEWTSPNNPPEKRLAFMLRGIAELLLMVGRLLKEASDSMLKRGG